MNVLNWSIPYLQYFEEMTRIPHGSFNEKQYSNYLIEFAQKHKLKYKQYDIGNVIIYKKASVGYENHPPVILQSHIDMVCEKSPGSAHDFKHDPLELYIKNGCIRAKNTTLGADDGIGVAYMLAILEDDQLAHPALECIFTVQEEVGSMGAAALDPRDISARKMIGLDDGGGTTTYISSAGGLHVDMKRNFQYKDSTASCCYILTVSGLNGGHSGPCISEERGNAIKIAARILYFLLANINLYLISINGGAKGNVIPSECTAAFASDASKDELEAYVKEIANAIKQELKYSDADLNISLAPHTASKTIDKAVSAEIIEFLYVLPDGFRHKSMKIDGLTVSSENIGVIRTEGEWIYTTSHLRGALDSYIDDLASEYKLLARHFHFEVNEHSRYPVWDYMENSPMRELLMRIYSATTGRQLTPVAVHGGLECGFIKEKFPDMDIVTIGPTTLGMHTVEESLNLESCEEIYMVVIKMLADI